MYTHAQNEIEAIQLQRAGFILNVTREEEKPNILDPLFQLECFPGDNDVSHNR